MNEIITIKEAKDIMGDNFIGQDELRGIKETLHFSVEDTLIPDIPYTSETLRKKKKDYLLILGISRFADGSLVNIRNLQEIFGKSPEAGEPCFYNQDWYDKEAFIDIAVRDEWYLIRKNVFDDSRTVQPNELMKKYTFPSAVNCAYAFFVSFLTRGVKLWYHDFIWCSDTDHNGDRIYVGKYHDEDGVNKNGFSIHRYLALRQCYGCIDWVN